MCRFFSEVRTGTLQRENLAEAARRLIQPGNSSADADEDAEEWLDELSELGIDPDQLDTLRQQVDAQASDEDDEAEADEEDGFRLWPCNEVAFQVFARCTWQRAVGGDQLLYTGIEAPEIESVMNILGVDQPKRIETLDLVRHAERSVMKLLNRPTSRPQPMRPMRPMRRR